MMKDFPVRVSCSTTILGNDRMGIVSGDLQWTSVFG